MAVISASTFDPLRRYVSTRLAQGVPIVDADWNEMDDIRKFEVRAYLKWFVGDGVPHGNDGFRIAASATAAPGDFVILAGVVPPPPGTTNVDIGLHNVGRCIVDGLDVTIQADVNFAAQPLHASAPGATALAARLGVPVIAAMTLPAGSGGLVTAYLDVWERLVTPSEDPSLVLPGLGTESCSRIRREWVVRVRDGGQAPQPGDPDHLAGHGYLALAGIARHPGMLGVMPGDITDLRQRDLLTPPSTLITDLFGLDPAQYRQGIGRPVISVRQAINAALRGQFPAGPDTPICPHPMADEVGRAFTFDHRNGLVAQWHSNRVGNAFQVFASRLDLANVGGGFSDPPQQVTAGAEHFHPHAASLPGGDLVAVYEVSAPPFSQVYFKRAPFAGLGAAPEVQVADMQAARPMVFVVSASSAVFIFVSTAFAPFQWFVRRRRLSADGSTDAWLDAAPAVLSNVASKDPGHPGAGLTQSRLHGVVDGTGTIWAVYPTVDAGIHLLRYDPATGTTPAARGVTGLNANPGSYGNPFVLATSAGDIWTLFTAVGADGPPGIWAAVTHRDQSFEVGQQVFKGIVENIAAVEDALGTIWLFWTGLGVSSRGSISTLFYTQWNPVAGWSQSIRETTDALNTDELGFALAQPDGVLWQFWRSERVHPLGDLYFRRIFSEV